MVREAQACPHVELPKKLYLTLLSSLPFLQSLHPKGFPQSPGDAQAVLLQQLGLSQVQGFASEH